MNKLLCLSCPSYHNTGWDSKCDKGFLTPRTLCDSFTTKPKRPRIPKRFQAPGKIGRPSQAILLGDLPLCPHDTQECVKFPIGCHTCRINSIYLDKMKHLIRSVEGKS